MENNFVKLPELLEDLFVLTFLIRVRAIAGGIQDGLFGIDCRSRSHGQGDRV